MVKNLPANTGDVGLIPGSGRSAGEGIGYPLQYSGLENSMDCLVHRVAKSQTRLSAFHSLYKYILLSVSFVVGNISISYIDWLSPPPNLFCINLLVPAREILLL